MSRVAGWWSVWRVRRLRARVAADRCPSGPGITHRWEPECGADTASFGGAMEWWRCGKCGTFQY